MITRLEVEYGSYCGAQDSRQNNTNQGVVATSAVISGVPIAGWVSEFLKKSNNCLFLHWFCPNNAATSVHYFNPYF